MYQIIIVPKDTPAAASLYFNSQEAAQLVYDDIYNAQIKNEDAVLQAKDEYGNLITMEIYNLSYALLIDIEKSKPLTQPKVPYGQTH